MFAPSPASTPLVCNIAAGVPLPAGCNLRQLARIEALVLRRPRAPRLPRLVQRSRRYSSSAMVQFVLWCAFAVSYLLAAGLMRRRRRLWRARRRRRQRGGGCWPTRRRRRKGGGCGDGRRDGGGSEGARQRWAVAAAA
ncbi:Os11g0481400 [Oryza sativa Japonica Group]|uniref:Os11g0481400 protein n=1 Tax=Oryza sativa subsp. japonica TaxID=39947 RepID=A0A0P0Y290_ORYSJ|nr:Os11g0481400 [Oryza sativa Japonica Group]